MNAQLRHLIRQQQDKHARARINALIEVGEIKVCGGCGIEREHYSPGCNTCQHRRQGRRRRLNPVYREMQRQQTAERRAREAVFPRAYVESPTEGATRASRR